MTSTLLETQDLQKSFGGVTATDHVSLQVEEGECHAVLKRTPSCRQGLVQRCDGRCDISQAIMREPQDMHLPGHILG